MEMATEIKREVKAGYEEIYNTATAKLDRLEEEARAKIEEMIREDKVALEGIIEMATHDVEVEVPDEKIPAEDGEQITETQTY